MYYKMYYIGSFYHGRLASLPFFSQICALMPLQTISLREANQNFSRLIAAVERGEGFVITRRGCEVARLTPSGGHAHAPAGATTDATIALPDAALSERLQRLETAVDKLVATLADAYRE